jgi:hypothetical protein
MDEISRARGAPPGLIARLCRPLLKQALPARIAGFLQPGEGLVALSTVGADPGDLIVRIDGQPVQKLLQSFVRLVSARGNAVTQGPPRVYLWGNRWPGRCVGIAGRVDGSSPGTHVI